MNCSMIFLLYARPRAGADAAAGLRLSRRPAPATAARPHSPCTARSSMNSAATSPISASHAANMPPPNWKWSAACSPPTASPSAKQTAMPASCWSLTLIAVPIVAFALYLPGSTPNVPSEPHAQWLRSSRRRTPSSTSSSPCCARGSRVSPPTAPMPARARPIWPKHWPNAPAPSRPKPWRCSTIHRQCPGKCLLADTRRPAHRPGATPVLATK